MIPDPAGDATIKSNLHHRSPQKWNRKPDLLVYFFCNDDTTAEILFIHPIIKHPWCAENGALRIPGWLRFTLQRYVP